MDLQESESRPIDGEAGFSLVGRCEHGRFGADSDPCGPVMNVIVDCSVCPERAPSVVVEGAAP
jgi:hypothetical protein